MPRTWYHVTLPAKRKVPGGTQERSRDGAKLFCYLDVYNADFVPLKKQIEEPER